MKRAQLLKVIVLKGFFLCVFIPEGYSQEEPLTVKEVEKIELYKHGRIATRKFSDYEIVPEGLLWKCYYRKDESTREFVKIVFEKELIRLLGIVNIKDTGINARLFTLEKKALVAAVDSMKGTYFRPVQKKIFIKSLTNLNRLERGIKDALGPWLRAEPMWFTIDICLKDKTKKTLSSLSYGAIYDLPWTLDEKKLYHPDISKIFAVFLDDKAYEDKQQRLLNQSVLRGIYNEEFQTRFNWENLKAHDPRAFAKLGNTLRPWRFRRSQESSELLLNSALLPENFKFGAFFKQPDTIMARIKQVEDRVAIAYKKSTFMAGYLQGHPETKLYADLYGTTDGHKSERKIMEKLMRLQKLPNATSDQGIFISVQEQTGKPWGKWILLPDDRLISMKLKTYNPNVLNICKIYNANGELLEDWGELNLL